MKRVSFPKDMTGYGREVGETTTVEAEPVESAKIDVVSVSTLITKCDELLKSATELYSVKAHKELYDSITDLNAVRRSLKAISLN